MVGSYDTSGTSGIGHILKIDNTGDKIWDGWWSGNGLEITSVAPVSGDGYVCSGDATEELILGLFDQNGNNIPLSGFNYDSQYYNSIGNSIIQTNSYDGFVLTGLDYYYPFPSSNIAVTRTDNTGESVWKKTYGTGIGYSILATGTGYVITGGDGENAFLLKIDESGNQIFKKTYSVRKGKNHQVSEGLRVRQTSDGGFVIVGNSYSSSYDVLVIKTNAQGKQEDLMTIGGSGDEIAYDVRQTDDGGYILTGYTTSTGAGGNDIYMVKIDPAPCKGKNCTG
jgi:hypothetical protein